MQIISNRELAKNLIDQIPDSKMYYITAYLQGAAVPELSQFSHNTNMFFEILVFFC